jgi:nicotinate-nucleotide adenylyltransferase
VNQHKIGVFGGSFDPFHHGHLNSVLTIAEKFNLNEAHLVPTFKSPARVQTQGSSPEHRVQMVRLGISGNEKTLKVDTREVDRGGVSYSIETLESLLKENPGAQLLLIVGMDQFGKFDQWKNFEKILTVADLVVTSRPGSELPYSLEEWPLGLRNMVADRDSKQALLKTGKIIYFVQLDDVEVSSTEVRKKIRLGQEIQALVPTSVDRYIRENKLYESVQQNIGDFEKFTQACKAILDDRGGVNVQIYDLRDRSAPSEFTLIASGTSTRHATALAEHLMTEVKKDYGVWPENVEGQGEGRWVVVDYGALIIHVFYDYVRQEYRLEELWTKPVKK